MKKNQKKPPQLLLKYESDTTRQLEMRLAKYKFKKKGSYELYNLSKNISEITNVVYKKPIIVNEMKKLIIASRSSSELLLFKQNN